MSSSKNNSSNGTIFMGPLSHRESTIDDMLYEQLHSKWNEETETKYLESVKKKASEKVRAMLLQAKRRSDEMIAEAEESIKHLKNEAAQNNTDAQNKYADAQKSFDSAHQDAIKKAEADMVEVLQEHQKNLGESTAIVLLSLHQQCQQIYDAWREELRLILLESVRVGTGWIVDSKTEEVFAALLDQSVRKLMDKKEYVVRVHPSDAALVTQVLENSKEKSWSMESNPELEPGSLEIENNNALVQNNSLERKQFVQDILENLILPHGDADEIAVKNVSTSIMNEMEKNPLLNLANEEEGDQNSDVPQNAEIPSPHDPINSTPSSDTVAPAESNISEGDISETLSSNDIENSSPTESTQDNPQNELNIQEMKVKTPIPDEILTESNNVPPEMLTPHEEADHLVEEFLSDFQEEPTTSLLDANSEDSSTPLPTEIADDILAEMGFESNENNT